MTQRVLITPSDRDQFIRLLQAMELPVTVSVAKGKNRSVEQNRLQRMWIAEAAEQLGDRTPEELRAYLKLHIGVPILRDENSEFCEAYDRVVKPLSYEDKLAIMAEPLSFPVTSIMTTAQKVKYLDRMGQHLSEQGVSLTIPREPPHNREAA